MRTEAVNRSLKLIYVVTEDWYFVSHRLPLAESARAAGFDVAVATRERRHGDQIRRAGIRLIPLQLSRRGGNPLRELSALWRIYRRERPDIVHHVALKAVLFGAIAARLAGVPAQVNAVAGLGWLVGSTRWPGHQARQLIGRVLATQLNRPGSLTIVQNPEDRRRLERAGTATHHLRLIRGAGVDLLRFTPAATPPPGPVRVVLVARMLWPKGVGEFVDAARALAGTGVDARFVLVGTPDDGNPSSIPEATLRHWDRAGVVQWMERREDVADVLRSAHIACLPSAYGEGIPKSLIEAAACGLPIVTTDAPGCREVVTHGVNGLLVPVGDATALAAALRELIADPAVRERMGAESRRRAEREFGLEAVTSQTLALYGELAAGGADGAL